MFIRKKERKKKILVLIDWDNLLISSEISKIEPTHFSATAGFDRIFKNLTELGEIIGVFVFLPPNNSMIWGEQIQRMGFKMIVCPRMKNKKGEDQDTVDNLLAENGEWLISQIPDIDYLVLGSGDKDFVPFLRKMKLKGLKIIIIAANPQSLALELEKLADKHPSTGKKMVFLFYPEEKE
ncbi:MAG: NYN domain-containing protein [Minisyncoccales bacterium]